MTEGIYFSKEIEMAVLGICTMEKSAFGRTHGLIDADMFYFEDNQKVYSCLREMYDNTIPIDALTIWERMSEQDISLNAGNIPWYMSELQRQVVSSDHLEYHCHLVKKFWRKRELEKLSRAGIDPHGDERKQAYQINERINEILGSELKQDWYSMDELMFKLFKHQEEMRSGDKKFITTGFKGIDRLNGGFSSGNMIVIGARPSVGKSALMGKMATSIARQGKTVGIISLEMNNTEIAARLASLETETSFGVVYRNLFNDENENRVFYEKISNTTINLPIYVSDKTKVDVSEIKSKAIKLKHKHGLDILFIDYLQLVDSATNKNYNREQEVARISRGIKLMAMDLEIPVVVLCQLNRAVTHRKGYKDRLPQLSDLRESGAIEQDADIVLMLHRDWMSGFEMNENNESTEFEADLVGAKWRNGATFNLPMEFNPPLMKFSEKGSTLIPVHIPQTPIQEDLF
jgi:replicative DNA helicase